MSAQVPHFSLPLRLVAGQAVVVEQDSAEEVSDCVQAVLRYRRGYRLELPEFGLPDQAFLEGGPRASDVTDAVRRWAPRANALTTAQLDDLVATVTVEIRQREGAQA